MFIHICDTMDGILPEPEKEEKKKSLQLIDVDILEKLRELGYFSTEEALTELIVIKQREREKPKTEMEVKLQLVAELEIYGLNLLSLIPEKDKANYLAGEISSSFEKAKELIKERKDKEAKEELKKAVKAVQDVITMVEADFEMNLALLGLLLR